MDKISQLENFLYAGSGDTGLLTIFINFVGAMLVSFLVRAFYIRYSFSLTGKSHIGSVLPVLTGVVFLVIIVVKSSLALSLGLVGALSIVRFRTPIKEPEELSYIFLAIAIGLGFGAGYTLITSVIVVAILFVIYFGLSNKNVSSSEYNLVLNWENQNITHDFVTEIIKVMSSSLKLVRFENSQNHNTSVYLIELGEEISIDALVTKLKEADSSINVSFFESKVNW